MNEYVVGKLVVATDVNSDGVDKGIAAIEAKLKKMEKIRNIKINASGATEVTEGELTEGQKRYKERLEATLKKLYEEKNALKGISALESNTTNEATNQVVEYNKIVDGVMTLSNGKRYILKTDEEITEEEQEQSEEMRKINLNLDKIGSSIKRAIRNTVRWGLAIFGISGAYMMVRNAMSVITQEDEQLKADIDYMRTAIAYTLEPLVRKIVEWAKQLMFYVGYIIKMWTGRNIFENANKSLQSADKSAKSLQKTLAGFDEMNVLNDNGSVGVAGALPSFDLSTLDFEVPKWLEWIGKNKDIVLGVIAAITGALVTMKLLGLNPIFGILGAILGLGIYEFVSGIIKFIKDPSWENFGQILEGLGIIIASITAILMVIGVASGPIGWIMIAVGTLTTLIGGLIQKLGKNKAAIKDVEQANKDLKEAKENVYNATQDYTQAVKDEEEAHRKLIEAQDETGLSGKELYDLVDSGKANYKDFNEQQRKVYDAYVNEQKAIGNVKDAEEKLIEARKIETQEAIESELANAKETESYDKLKESVVKAFKEGKISAEEARDYLSRAMADMSNDSKKTFLEDVPNNIKAGLDPNRYDSFATKFKNWWNKWIKGLDTTVEITGVAVGGGGGGSSGSSSSKYVPRAKGGIYYPSKLPKLASGGIINMPGRGVPYHGAYIGERGAEAVVPLTDSQQMALLGEAIGKYITINATIPVYAYNRQVDRQIKRIQAEDNFAGNR